MNSFPLPVVLFIKYFWFVATAINIYTVLMAWGTTKKLIAEKPENKQILNHSVRWLSVLYIIPFLLLGIFQTQGGFKHPFFIFSGNYSNIFILLSWLSLIAMWSLGCYWIFFKGGAKAFAMLKPVTLKGVNINEIGAKLFFGFFFVFGLIIFVFGVLLGYFNMIPADELFNI